MLNRLSLIALLAALGYLRLTGWNLEPPPLALPVTIDEVQADIYPAFEEWEGLPDDYPATDTECEEWEAAQQCETI